MKPQHTPTPWNYDSTWALIMGPKGEEIGAIHAGSTKDGARVRTLEAKANAEFIVRAVNAHDDLVALLKELHGVLDGGIEGHLEHRPNCRFCITIRKAEGR